MLFVDVILQHKMRLTCCLKCLRTHQQFVCVCFCVLKEPRLGVVCWCFFCCLFSPTKNVRKSRFENRIVSKQMVGKNPRIFLEFHPETLGFNPMQLQTFNED